MQYRYKLDLKQIFGFFRRILQAVVKIVDLSRHFKKKTTLAALEMLSD